MGRDMPCGDCCVCDEPLDHSEAGFCRTCGGGFHWSECGRWCRSEHTCDNCMPADEYEDESND